MNRNEKFWKGCCQSKSKYFSLHWGCILCKAFVYEEKLKWTSKDFFKFWEVQFSAFQIREQVIEFRADIFPFLSINW